MVSSFLKNHSHRAITYVVIACISGFVIIASFWYQSERIKEEQEERLSKARIEKDYRDRFYREDTKEYAVNVAFPVINEEGAALVNQALQDVYKKKVTLFVTQAKERYANGILNQMPSTMSSSFSLTFSQVATTERFVSLLVNNEIFFAGAAHPNLTRETYIFDRKEKRLVEEAELFVPLTSYKKSLAQLSLDYFKARNQEEGNEGVIDVSGNNEGFVPNEKNFSKVLPTNDGIIVYFDAYEIAPYVFGPQEAHIPYSSLNRKKLINQDGILGMYYH